MKLNMKITNQALAADKYLILVLKIKIKKNKEDQCQMDF